jgi:GNAT superfamily N-acetyltransferase
MVRAAALTDIDRITPMYEWLFAPPGSRPPSWALDRAADALANAISSDGSIVLLAEAEGEFVGFCTAYDDIESVRFGRRVWVEDLAVHPERRSLGIGKDLLGAAMRWARDRGATHLELDSAESRHDAHRFYEREGAGYRSVCFGWEL